MKQNDAAYKIVRSGRHFQVPRAVQGVGSCYSNCEGAKKQGGLTKKTILLPRSQKPSWTTFLKCPMKG